MSVRLLTAGLAAALAVTAPAAKADEPTYDCIYYGVHVPAVGATHEGVVVGYVVHAGDASATIRCYFTVNGVEVSSTPTSSGVVVANHVSFSAGEGDSVQLCAEVTTTHGTVTQCKSAEPDPVPVPPIEVWEVVERVIVDVVNPVLCPVLAALAGDYAGIVVVNSQGDVYVGGEPQWDCPPYDIWPSGG